MSARSVVVDGSNIATEGRSMPSLQQLVEAVAEYQKEFPDDEVIVVVDATFGHRIEESERAAFDDAVAHNEIVSPPAGAIGRGDAFLLRIADKVGATVLSNDSFQEFHGEHEWLFNNGRLIGGKPVPGVGWIFTPRTPVRGPRSRTAVAEAKRAKKAAVKVEGGRSKKVAKAIEVATDEVVEPSSPSARRRRRRRGASGAPPAEPVNEPLPFIQFVADHKPGSEVEGEVDSFSSHGAFVRVGEARCYIPLSALGDPPPRAARDVLNKGETRTFVVQALDPPRRGIELALPGFVRVAGTPTEETVEEEIAASAAAKPARTRATKKAAAEPEAPVKKAAKKAAPAKKAAAKKAATKKAEPTKKAAAAKKAAPVAKKAAAPAKKAAAKKAAATKKATPTKKAAAPAKKATPTKKAAAKKAAPTKKAAATKKATAKKAAEKAT